MNTEGTLDYQIELEKRIARIYGEIATQVLSFGGNYQERTALWENLAQDESDHATLLSIEKALLQTGARVKKPVEMDPDTREEIDQLLSDCERKIKQGISEAEALDILVSIEACDNRIFKSLLKATDSKLLSRFVFLSRSYKAHEARVQKGLDIYKRARRSRKRLNVNGVEKEAENV